MEEFEPTFSESQRVGSDVFTSRDLSPEGMAHISITGRDSSPEGLASWATADCKWERQLSVRDEL